MHLNPPFRAEHVGSLVRTPEIHRLRALLEKHECSLDELQTAEDDAVKHVVNVQRELGLKTITDGEMRRRFFFDGFFENLDGMQLITDRPINTFKRYIPHIEFMYMTGVKEAETIYCNGKIERNKPLYVSQFKYLKSLVTGEEVANIKVNFPSPSWFHQRHGSDATYDLNVYKDDDEYFSDLAVAYKAEFQELYDNGCRHIQIDDPTFAYFCAESVNTGMEEAGVDSKALLDTYVRAINMCTKDRPSNLRVSVHICRGNFTGGVYFTQGPYDRIAKKVFNDLDVDAFYLEYDDERSGSFDALESFPPDKVAVLGLITTKRARLESVDDLKKRIHEAASAMARNRSFEDAMNQICLSPQCGFSSTWEGNPVTEEDQKKKVTLLQDVVKQVWPQS